MPLLLDPYINRRIYFQLPGFTLIVGEVMILKRTSVIAVLFLLVISITVFSADQRMFVALIDFTRNKDSELISSYFASRITGTGKYRLVTRDDRDIAALINESKLSYSTVSSDASQRLKLKNVKVIMPVKITNSKYSTSTSKIVIDGKTKYTYTVTYRVEGSFQILSVETGEILASRTIDHESSDSYSNTAGSFQESYDVARKKALQLAAASMEKVLNELVVIRASVIERISEDTYLVSGGVWSGFTVGSKVTFLLSYRGSEMKQGYAEVVSIGNETCIIKVWDKPEFDIVPGTTFVVELPNQHRRSEGVSKNNFYGGLLVTNMAFQGGIGFDNIGSYRGGFLFGTALNVAFFQQLASYELHGSLGLYIPFNKNSTAGFGVKGGVFVGGTSHIKDQNNYFIYGGGPFVSAFIDFPLGGGLFEGVFLEAGFKLPIAGISPGGLFVNFGVQSVNTPF